MNTLTIKLPADLDTEREPQARVAVRAGAQGTLAAIQRQTGVKLK